MLRPVRFLKKIICCEIFHNFCFFQHDLTFHSGTEYACSNRLLRMVPGIERGEQRPKQYWRLYKENWYVRKWFLVHRYLFDFFMRHFFDKSAKCELLCAVFLTKILLFLTNEVSPKQKQTGSSKKDMTKSH